MKRYKLKKDLPTFKAGDEFYLDSNNNLYHKPKKNLSLNLNMILLAKRS